MTSERTLVRICVGVIALHVVDDSLRVIGFFDSALPKQPAVRDSS